MSSAAVEFTVVGVDKASGTFDDVAASSERSAKKIKASSDDAAGGFDRTSEGADTLASKGAQAAGALSGLGDTVGGPFGAAMQGAGLALQTAADSGDLLNAAIEGGGKAAKAAGGWAKKFAVSTGLMTAATEAETAGQWGLNAAFLANPMTWIVVGIVAVVAGLVLLATKTKWGKKIVSAAWDGIKASAKAVADFFTKDIPKAARAVWDATSKWFGKAVDFVKGLPAKVGSAAHGLWNGLTSTLSSVVGSYSSGGGGIKGRLWSAVDFVKGLPARIGSAARGLWSGLTSNIASAIGSYSSGGGGIKGRLWSLVSTVTGLPSRIGRAASGAFDGLSGAFKSALNWIIGKWNGLSFTLPSMTVFGHKIGGATISTPDIPYLAKGGTLEQGGWAVVGEKGPELAHLPARTTVYPNNRPPAAANNGPLVNIEHYHADGMSSGQVAADLAWEMRR